MADFLTAILLVVGILFFLWLAYNAVWGGCLQYVAFFVLAVLLLAALLGIYVFLSDRFSENVACIVPMSLVGLLFLWWLSR